MPAASSARPRACATASAPIAVSTRRSPRRASSAPPSACAWPAGGRSARCSTTPSRYPCLDQLITHVGRYRWRTGGKMEFPLVVRMPYGGGVRAPELHDDSPETYYVHTPGVKVAIPSTPADAKGLLAAAIRDPDPVVDPRAEAHLQDDAGRGARRRARRAARQGAPRPRGRRRLARRVRLDGARLRSGRGRARRRGASRCSTFAR